MAQTKIPAGLLDKSSHVDFADNEKLRLGTGSDLQIYHNGSNASIILDNNNGSDLLIQSNNIVLEKPDGENMIHCAGDGAVQLYHNGSSKLATTSGGVTVTGSISGATATASGGTNTTALASTAFVQQELTTLIGGAPSTLNDLNELAAAINDDANYNSTLTTALATKLPLAGGTMTGNIAHASDFTLDVGGDINLDADGGDVNLKDGGTAMGRLGLENGDLNIANIRQDYDIRFKGMDGNTTPFTALRLDMSAAGAATFNSTITTSAKIVSGSGSVSQAQIEIVGSNSGTNPAATGHMASSLQLFNNHNTDNAFSGIDFNNQGDLVDARIVGIHANQSSRHGEIAFLVHNGSALTERMRLNKDGNLTVGGTLGVTGAATFNSTINGATINVFETDSILISHDGSTGTISNAIQNTGLGHEVFDDLTGGDYNTGVGYHALTKLTTGSNNTAVGRAALEANLVGTNNVAVGFAALEANTGSQNVAIGKSALAVFTESYNTAVGYRAMLATTSGERNTAIGYDTMVDLQTGEDNTAVGYNALKIVTGGDNTAVGTRAGDNTTSGVRNVYVGIDAGGGGNGSENCIIGRRAGRNATSSNTTAVGTEALQQNTGAKNSAVGYQCLINNQGGTENTAMGYFALTANVGGNYNTAFGMQALDTLNGGHRNVAVGREASRDQSSGDNNTAIGTEALKLNATGDSNTAVGSYALNIASGSDNTAIGFEAGKGVSTGTYNVAVGKNALAHNSGGSTGSFNIAIGYESLRGISSGAENIAMGRDAGRKITSGSGNVALGHEALLKLTTAGGNTMVGFQAGENVTGGSNTMIGYKAGEATEGGVHNVFIGQNTRGTHPSHSQAVAIGYNIDAAPGQVAIGTSAMGKVYNEFNTDALWSQGSDVRLKKNINDSTLGLNFIKDLRPVTYTWKPSNELPDTFPMYQEENGRDIETVMTGLIAQEVKTAIDTSGVSRFGGWGEDNHGIQQIRAQAFVFPLIKAIQEQQTIIDDLKSRLETLEG